MTKLEHDEEAIEATELHLRRMISLIPCNDMGEWVVTLKNWDAINKALNAAMKLARIIHARSRPERVDEDEILARKDDLPHIKLRPEPGGELEADFETLKPDFVHMFHENLRMKTELAELKERLKLTDEEKEPVEYLSKCKRDEFTYYEDKLLDIILRITSSRGNG